MLQSNDNHSGSGSLKDSSVFTCEGSVVPPTMFVWPRGEHTWETLREVSSKNAIPGTNSHFQKLGPCSTSSTQNGRESRCVQ